MASTKATFTLDEETAERARRLNIDISAAARQGVADAVRSALARSDQAAYRRMPEEPDPFWDEAAAWSFMTDAYARPATAPPPPAGQALRTNLLVDTISGDEDSASRTSC